MKLSDLFVPKWQHSNPQVWIQAVKRMDDANLLVQIAEKDDDADVREAAGSRLAGIRED